MEREIQALVSKKDNVHTHHPYHAWDPVPSLSAVSPGKRKKISLLTLSDTLEIRAKLVYI